MGRTPGVHVQGPGPVRPGLAANGAGYAGKDIVGIRADQPDCAHDDHQNHGQHHRVFGNVLALLVLPKSAQEVFHRLYSPGRVLGTSAPAHSLHPERPHNNGTFEGLKVTSVTGEELLGGD